MTAAILTDRPAPAFLDITAPGLRADGPEVRAARAQYWRADTLIGPAILDREAVWAMLRDDRLGQGSATRLDLQGIEDGPLHRWWQSMILNVDGSAHDRLRRLVVPAFGPKVINALRPRMRDHIEACIVRLFAGAADQSDVITCDATETIADTYPMAVLGTLLDIPVAQLAAVRQATNDLGLAFSLTVAADLERIEAALAHLFEVADRLIETRLTRAAPQPEADVVGRLLAARDGDDRLSIEELRNLVVTVLFAGHDTTKQQLALGLYEFASRPSNWELLAARPELAATAVDEVLRVAPAVPVISRRARQVVTYRDLHLPAGSHLLLLVGSANTDHAVFGDAPFDITARRPRAMTFGGGAHHCLGHLIARAELEEALPALAGALTDLRIAGDVRWRPSSGVTGPARLPISFRLRD